MTKSPLERVCALMNVLPEQTEIKGPEEDAFRALMTRNNLALPSKRLASTPKMDTKFEKTYIPWHVFKDMSILPFSPPIFVYEDSVKGLEGWYRNINPREIEYLAFSYRQKGDIDVYALKKELGSNFVRALSFIVSKWLLARVLAHCSCLEAGGTVCCCGGDGSRCGEGTVFSWLALLL